MKGKAHYEAPVVAKLSRQHHDSAWLPTRSTSLACHNQPRLIQGRCNALAIDVAAPMYQH